VTRAREDRWAWIAAAIALAAQIAAFHRVRLDDAYITYRYGANLANGAGFVFNAGDRMMGSTSPGEALVSALIYAIAGQKALPAVMASLGCVAWTAQALVVFRMLRAVIGARAAGFVAAAIALGVAGSAAWVPLETNAAAALTLLSLLLALRSRWIPAAIACAGATLMRPDACLAALPLIALCVREERGAAWKPAATYIALLLPWVLFATAYFGSPIPQSALRKVHHEDALASLLHIATYVPLPYEPEAGLVVIPAIAILWIAAIAGGVALVRRDPRLAILPAYGALHAIAYAILRTDPAFQWHLYPAALVFAVLALAFLASDLAPLRARLVTRACAAALAAYGVWWTATFAIDEPHRFWFGRRDALYRRIAAYVKKRADPGDILHAEEAGTLGYVTGLTINDAAGLVTREPERVLRAFVRGEHEGDRLRWLVLNDAQLPSMYPVFQKRALLPFEQEGARLYLVDLRAPVTPPPPTEAPR